MNEEKTMTEDSEFEALLRETCVPAAFSGTFAGRLDAAMAEDSEFEARLRACCVPAEMPARRGNNTNAVAFPRTVWKRVFAGAVAAASLAGAAFLTFLDNGGQALPAPEYLLVSDENVLCAVDESSEPVLQENGTVVRPTRYVYANTKRWQDAHSSKQIVSSEECEETVPLVFAVY